MGINLQSIIPNQSKHTVDIAKLSHKITPKIYTDRNGLKASFDKYGNTVHIPETVNSLFIKA